MAGRWRLAPRLFDFSTSELQSTRNNPRMSMKIKHKVKKSRLSAVSHQLSASLFRWYSLIAES